MVARNTRGGTQAALESIDQAREDIRERSESSRAGLNRDERGGERAVSRVLELALGAAQGPPTRERPVLRQQAGTVSRTGRVPNDDRQALALPEPQPGRPAPAPVIIPLDEETPVGERSRRRLFTVRQTVPTVPPSRLFAV